MSRIGVILRLAARSRPNGSLRILRSFANHRRLPDILQREKTDVRCAVETEFDERVSFGIRRSEFDDYLWERAQVRCRLRTVLHTVEQAVVYNLQPPSEQCEYIPFLQFGHLPHEVI